MQTYHNFISQFASSLLAPIKLLSKYTSEKLEWKA